MKAKGDPKRLKPAQAERLRKIALDGRRKPADRRWATSFLSDHGIEVGANIPGYATPGKGRNALLEAHGGCVALNEARSLYRRPALPAQIKRNNVLAYHGKGRRVFIPVWQFKPDGGVLDGLPAVLKVLHKSPHSDGFGPFCFLLQPDPMLGLRTPLEALRIGETKQVLDAAIEHVRGP